MDGEKKQSGRPQAYTRESQRYIQELELRRRRQEEQKRRTAPQNSGVSGRMETGEALSVRRREQENAQKMRILSVVLAVLIVALIAAIIYEVVLGHGVRETGGERMARQGQADVVIDTAPDGAAVGDSATGSADGAAVGSADAGSADGAALGSADAGPADGAAVGNSDAGSADGTVVGNSDAGSADGAATGSADAAQ